MGIGTSSSSSGASAPRANAYAVNRDASELGRSPARKAPASAQPGPMHVIYTGLRPGEKLAEKVFSDAEERVPSAHPKIWATRRTEPPEDFPLFLERLYAAAHDGDSVLVKELFQ